jgi:hypothetical protein
MTEIFPRMCENFNVVYKRDVLEVDNSLARNVSKRRQTLSDKQGATLLPLC